MSLVEIDDREREFAERFRQSHHALALMFAMDYTASMISRKTGRSIRSLTLMYNDPLFRELIAQKQAKIAEIGEKKIEEFAELDLDFNILQRKNMIAAELDLADKLEAARESGMLLGVRDYNAVIADRADRQGHSKHTIIHHDQDFGARLDRAISRSGKEREVKQIDLSPVGSEVTAGSIPATGLAERVVSPTSITYQPSATSPDPSSPKAEARKPRSSPDAASGLPASERLVGGPRGGGVVGSIPTGSAISLTRGRRL